MARPAQRLTAAHPAAAVEGQGRLSVRRTSRIVVVGAGLAGANAALELRRLGFDGSLTLLGAEAHLPYQRPPLSKGFLQGAVPYEELLVAPRAEYERLGVELVLGRPAVGLDVQRRRVSVEGRDDVPYDRVLVATGCRMRRLPVAGAGLAGVFDLRTVDDAERIRAAAKPGLHAVVIGLGFIGCEVAASLRARGLRVTAIEPGSAPLVGVLGREVAEVIGHLHRRHGVGLLLGDGVERLEGVRRVERVVTRSGLRLDCDLVVAGIGVDPEVDLLAAAGARVSNGVDVDDRCHTSLPGVFAAGDIANHLHPLFGRIRVEHFNNGERQGRAAAASLLDRGEPYDYVHSFWSEQYDQKLEYVGFAGEWDRIAVEGSLPGLDFIVRYFAGHRLLAAAAIGRGGDPELDEHGELREIARAIRKNLTNGEA
jgi:3-phenylpropionate/trans-cinnamate dioxygenase ferredoxin reductase subunit